MTPQEAYQKRYAGLDGGQHTWHAAPPHVKDLWLAAWTIAWSIAEQTEREACADTAWVNAPTNESARQLKEKILSRGQA